MDFIQYLINKKVIDKEQGVKIKTEAKKTGRKEEEIIISRKIVPENKLFRLKSQFLKVPLEELIENIPQNVLYIIPRESVKFYKMVPLRLDKKKRVLDVGMVFPEDTQAREALNFLARQEKLVPNIFLISFSNFEKYLSRYRVVEREIEKALEKLREEVSGKNGEKEGAEKEEFERLAEEAPIIKMVAVILRQAVEGKASDIHIEPSYKNLRVRYRLDGVLYPTLFLPLKVHPSIVARIKILSGLKIDENRIPQDGRFSAEIDGKKIDFRVSTLPTTLGEKVAIRVLNPEEGLKGLGELGFRDQNLKIVKEAITKPYGLILATGPTGSGKTTTLYALLRMLNKDKTNIVTLEDPVEYFIEGINQSQIRPEINYTFARGLRQLLRQDPDVIMVGEIRDEETASLAVHAGLTGHLVLSTLHTNNALGVIPRLIDMGIEPFLISPTLTLAISQRLVRVLCPFCKVKMEAKGEERKYILSRLKNVPRGVKLPSKLNKAKGKIFIYRPKGCRKCNFKGYSGRVGVFEILKVTKELSNLIAKRPTEEEILKVARKQGMISMEEDGILKVLSGITSLEEVMRVTQEL
jgi:type IV pilus assembly protein PilB